MIAYRNISEDQVYSAAGSSTRRDTSTSTILPVVPVSVKYSVQLLV